MSFQAHLNLKNMDLISHLADCKTYNLYPACFDEKIYIKQPFQRGNRVYTSEYDVFNRHIVCRR